MTTNPVCKHYLPQETIFERTYKFTPGITCKPDIETFLYDVAMLQSLEIFHTLVKNGVTGEYVIELSNILKVREHYSNETKPFDPFSQFNYYYYYYQPIYHQPQKIVYSSKFKEKNSFWDATKHLPGYKKLLFNAESRIEKIINIVDEYYNNNRLWISFLDEFTSFVKVKNCN
jgi:hypothetical protein